MSIRLSNRRKKVTENKNCYISGLVNVGPVKAKLKIVLGVNF